MTKSSSKNVLVSKDNVETLKVSDSKYFCTAGPATLSVDIKAVLGWMRKLVRQKSTSQQWLDQHVDLTGKGRANERKGIAWEDRK